MQNYPPTLYTTWTRAQHYPKYARRSGQLECTDKFHVLEANFELSHLEAATVQTWEGLYVLDATAEPDEATHKMHITLRYGSPTASGAPPSSDGKPEYYMEDGGQEIPIDKIKKNGTPYFSSYKVNWNYHCVSSASSPSTPGAWSTATNPETSIGAEYRWVKSLDSMRSDESLVKAKTKNAESVLVPSPVVVEIRRYSSYGAAAGSIIEIGTRVTPDKTFGLSGGWLVVGSSVRQEGRQYVRTTRYQMAEEWDTDLYSAG